MIALLASMVCLAVIAPPQPLLVSIVTHCDTPEAEIISNDGLCSVKGCGYADLAACATCIQWSPWKMSDSEGCVDMDALPIPKEGSVYWVWTR